MISVITVSYKTLDYVERLLASVQQYVRLEDVELFVVINGDGTDPSTLRDRFPFVKWIVSEKNLGFAGGCNLAGKEAKGELVLLVNPDVVFESDAIQAVADEMRRDPSVGIGGISLRNMDGTQQACVWRFPRPIDQLLVLSKLPHLLGPIGPVGKWLMRGFDYGKSSDVDQVMGAFFCIRREVIERIGWLDDGFFLWYEEVDFCRRTVNAGFRVRYYAGIQAKHSKGSSFDRVSTLQKQAYMRKSLRRYMRKHFGAAWASVFTLLDPVFVALAWAASVVKPM